MITNNLFLYFTIINFRYLYLSPAFAGRISVSWIESREVTKRVILTSLELMEPHRFNGLFCFLVIRITVLSGMNVPNAGADEANPYSYLYELYIYRLEIFVSYVIIVL